MMSPTRPKPAWQIQQEKPEMQPALDDAFRQVMDPELGLNIMELGLVRDVQIKDDSVHIVMIMTTPFCPYAPALLESTRAKAEEVVNMPTTIEMGMQMWDPSFMEEGVGADWGLF
jgi:metal-sulfur cluster biosynthetic enzyme